MFKDYDKYQILSFREVKQLWLHVHPINTYTGLGRIFVPV